MKSIDRELLCNVYYEESIRALILPVFSDSCILWLKIMATTHGTIRYIFFFHVFSIFGFCQKTSLSYDIRCPKQSEWTITATAKCGKVLEYFCLLDDNVNSYKASCKRNPDLTRDITWKKGQKCVIRGNLDGEDCSTERYQPLPFRTDGLSDCVFKKTNCTDEGLIMYTHGSTTKDTQCRCDHSKGFAFLSKPKHSCYCIPSQEDCSCYQKECQRGFKLSLNYTCISVDSQDDQKACSSFNTRSLINTGSQRHNLNQTMETDLRFLPDKQFYYLYENLRYTVRHVGTIVVALIIIGHIGLIVLLLLFVFDKLKLIIDMTEIYASPGQMTTLKFHIQSTVPLEETEKTLRKEEDGTELILSIGSGGSLIYTFDDPGVDDTGTYTCIVSNRIGKDTAVLKLVIEKPTVSVDSHEIFASQHQPTRLEFYLKSTLPVEKILRKEEDGTELIMSSGTEGSLVYMFDKPVEDDTGTYTCIVSNRLGEDRAVIKLMVGERPTMVIEDESYIANVGEKVCLICKLDSKPQVIDLTWWFNDEVISSTNDEHGDSRFQGGTIECPDLTITNITYTDKGSYTCCARNIIGTCTSSPIVLSVEDDTSNEIEDHNDENQTCIPLSMSPVYVGCITDGSVTESPSAHRFAQVVLDKFEVKVARQKSKEFIEEELRVVVIGKTGAGKSATCNMIVGKNMFKSGISMAGVTTETQHHRVDVYGQKLLLIDTPGVFDTNSAADKTEREIKKCIGIGAPGLHAILFVMRLDRFTEEDKNTIDTFLKYFGKSEMEAHVIIVFTRGDELGNIDLEDFLSKAPQELQVFMDRCDKRRVVFNNKLPMEQRFSQVHGLISLIGKFRLEKEMEYYTDDLFKAAEKSMQRREDEIRNKLKDDMEKLVKEKEEMFEKEFADREALLENLETDKEKIEGNRKGLQEFKCKQQEELTKFKNMCDEIIRNVRQQARQNIIEEEEEQ